MKKSAVLIAALTLISLNSYAGTLLECSTDGSGLADLKVIATAEGPASIEIQKGEYDSDDQSAPAPLSYAVLSGLDSLKAGGAATLTAQKPAQVLSDYSQNSGGELTQAALLAVAQNQKSAVLSFEGNVYNLHCFPAISQ
jgi:hypothetical protein